MTFIQQREVCLQHTEGRQPVVELKIREHKQRHKEKQSAATGQENVRIQDEKEDEDQRKDVERANDNKTCMEQDKTSGEKRETEMQTGYRKKTDEDSLISNDTPQQDCTCSSIPDDQLNISCEQITNMEVLHNTDRQEIPVDQTLGVCIAQECVSDDIIQSDSAHASMSDEQLQISVIKITNLKVHHDTDLQKKAMQHIHNTNILG